MKNKNMYILMVVCVALAVTFTGVVAQNRIGTSAASELLIPVGARDMGIGGSGIASTRGVDALYWNPAGVGRMSTSAEAMFSTMSYIADIGVNYGAVAAKFGEFGVLGISLKSLDFGSIPLTTQDDPENSSGRFYSPAFFNLGLTYSRALTDAIAVGGTVRIISEQIDRVSASGFALDVGVQYSQLVGVQGLHLGIAVKNIGPQMKFDGPGLLLDALASGRSRPGQRYKSDAASFELPSLVEIGLAYDSKMSDNMGMMFTGSFINNNLFYDEYRFGGELMMGMESVTLFARMGGSAIPEAEKDLKENIFGISFGAGLNYKAPGIEMTVDYAYRAVEFFKANNVLTLKFGF